ncbi:MAG: ABC transporter substrate-binding protein [Candidatus Faecivicinus sp.]
MKKILSIIVIAVMMMTMASFSAFADEQTVAGTPRSETLVVEGLDGVISNASQHNPYMSGTNFSAGLHQLVYSHLWEMNTIEGNQIADLAAEMPTPLNDDYTSFKVVLTEGIKWSDGEDFDAEDVCFTINELLRLKDTLPGGAQLANLVESCEYVDKYELIINTVGSRPRLSEDIGATVWGNFLYIIPEHYWKEHDLTTEQWEYPIGTGPYTLKDYDPNGYWFLYELREDAEYSDVGVLTGKVPEAKYVLFTAYGTEEKKTMAMLNNEVDILCDISPEAWEVLQAGNPNVACWLPDYPYGCFDDPCERGMQFNCDVEPFDQKEVRWAMALSLDMVQVSMDTFSGQMRVSPLCMPPTTFMNEAFHKQMRQQLIDYTWEDGYQPFDKDYALKLYDVLIAEGYDTVEGMTEDELVELFGIGWWKHDTEKAEELLTGAGCERDAEGFWSYNGERITFEIICPSGYETQSERLAYAVQSQWYEFGFDVTVQASESSFFNSSDDTGSYTCGSYWPSCGVMTDLYSQLRGWHSDYYTPSGSVTSGNTARFRSEKLDAVLDEMASQAPSDATYELSKEALMIMADEAAWLPMFGTSKLVPTNSTYWTNYPDSENPYNGPWWWWSCFKFIVTEFKAA